MSGNEGPPAEAGIATVPFGSFDGLLQTKDTNPLNKPEPQVEHKFYAKGSEGQGAS